MGLKLTVGSLDDVEETARSLYKEDTDPKTKKTVYILDVEGSGPDVFHPVLRPLKDELARRRTSEGTALKELEKLRPLAELGDLDDIRAKLDKYPELEAAAAGKLDDAKLNTLVEGRLKVKLAPLERELAQAKARAGEFEGKYTELTVKEKGRRIKDSLMSAAAELKVTDTAREDIALYAAEFELLEDGAVVVKEGSQFSQGLSPKQWLEDISTSNKRPHWWGPTSGGGMTGSRTTTSHVGANPWAHGTWNVTEQNTVYRTKGKDYAERLAKQAGTTLGGKRPAPASK